MLHTYLPQDRLRALARGETLPDRTIGSVLFADISGFTALTEKPTRELEAWQPLNIGQGPTGLKQYRAVMALSVLSGNY